MKYSPRLVTRERLTAAHYIAMTWALDGAPDPGEHHKSMDFGARRSEVAMLCDLAGYKAVALDRDPEIVKLQRAVAARWTTRHDWACVHCEEVPPGQTPFPSEHFHLITALWAIQHNCSLDEQKAVVKELVRTLTIGGVLRIVSSYRDTGAVSDVNRTDPQLIVGPIELTELIVASGCELTTPRKYFWYEHSTVNGDWCEPGRALAVAYELRKVPV